MMPVLYSANETAFDTNGIGILSDVIDCTVTEIINSSFEMELRYPVRGVHFSDIRIRSIITAKPDPVTDTQPFRVYRITKLMDGIVAIYARHRVYDLMGVTVAPFTATNSLLAFDALGENAVTDCPFTFSVDQIIAKPMTVKTPQAIWTLLGSGEGCVLDVYGGEYQFDGVHVDLLSQRGMDRGVSIRYGKNLTSLEQDENCANCYTAVHPYWSDGQSQLIQLPEKIVQAPGDHGYTKIMQLDLSAEWDAAPTEAQLRKAAEQYISDNDVGVPAVSWRVEFVQLEQSEEYKGTALLERVLLGDTVTVQYADLGVSATARAVEVRYKPVLERYDSITLGQVRQGFVDTVVAQKKELAKKPNESYMQQAIKALTAALLGANGGAVRLLDTNGDDIPDTLYIADGPDPDKAVKVWRFNYEGWGASKNGYNGPFTLGASFDTGILAEFITAGTLYGMLLKAGIIESESGKIRIDLTSEDEPVFNTGISTNGLTIRNEDRPNKDICKIRQEVYPGTSIPYFTMETYSVISGKELISIGEWLSEDDNGSVTTNGPDMVMWGAHATPDIDIGCGSIGAWVNLGEQGASDSKPAVRSKTDLINNGAEQTIRCKTSNIHAKTDANGALVQLEDTGSAGNAELDLTAAGNYFKVVVNNDGVSLQIPGRSAKNISWKSNGDGTYTLIGADTEA